MAVGGALVAVGPFISWVSVPLLGSLNLFSLLAASEGAEGVAWFPVVIGGLVFLTAMAAGDGAAARTFSVIGGLLIGLLGIPLAISLANEVGRSGGFAQLGLGSWMTVAGAVLMFVGAVSGTTKARPHKPKSRRHVPEKPAPPAFGGEPTTMPAAGVELPTLTSSGDVSRHEPQPPQKVEEQPSRGRSRRLLRKSVIVPILVVVLLLAGMGIWRRVDVAHQPSVDTSTPGWATLAVTSDDDSRPEVEAPLVWTDQARVCWDVVGDLEKLEVSIFGNEVNEGFETRRPGHDCRYFSPLISHATATDCASVVAFHEGEVQWKLVVQQEKGESYGLSGINSTYQYGLLDDPCTGEPFEVPRGFVDCDDGTYAKSESDCTWAERQFDSPYQPAGYPGWTCYPDTGECVHENGSFVSEGPQEAGSYCDRSGCYLDY